MIIEKKNQLWKNLRLTGERKYILILIGGACMTWRGQTFETYICSHSHFHIRRLKKRKTSKSPRGRLRPNWAGWKLRPNSPHSTLPYGKGSPQTQRGRKISCQFLFSTPPFPSHFPILSSASFPTYTPKPRLQLNNDDPIQLSI